MNIEEFHAWQAGQPDLHEMVDSRPVRMSREHQVSRQFIRAAWVASGTMGHEAGADLARRAARRPGETDTV